MKKTLSLFLSLIMIMGVLTSVPLTVIAAEVTVFVTASGSKYHLSSACSNMKNPIPKKLSEAQSLGYGPCSKCVSDGFESGESAPSKCSKPKLKEISNTTSGVKITWGKVSGADKYYVYRKTSSGSYTKIGTTTKTSYTDEKATSGRKYYYIVKAVNKAGKSDSSNTLSKLYLADTTLKTPSSTKSGVKLSWSKVTGAEGYMVYRKTGSGSYTKIATVKGNSKVTYTDKSAKKGKTYTYKIKAYKSKTYSAYSNTRTIKDKY